jgi:Zn-dependent M28 family amino/carboxypeptidase
MVNRSIETALGSIRSERIEAHLRFLSHEFLEGRGAGSRGGRIAEEYIRSVFAAARLHPAPGVGYLQSVPMTGMLPAPTLAFDGTGGRIVPRYGEDFVLQAGVHDPEVEVECELVFAGFGITAPEYGWSDYEGTDMRGKVALIRVNDPGTADTPDFFEGQALSYYGRWTYKFEEAARRGAAGAILIHTTESAGYPWAVVRTSNTGEQFELSESPRAAIPIRGWITEDVARRLLGGSGGDSLLEESSRPGYRARSLGITVSGRVLTELRSIESSNVLGYLPGHQPDRQEEPIILMAHHDHLGTTMVDGRQVIYPGAADNASGVALLLTLAEAVSETGFVPRRPFLFVATTAEESGLLGAEWYVRNPVHPLSGTAAVLNVDGANLDGPTSDIAPLGVSRSTLGGIVRQAAAAEGLEVVPEQHPEKGMFFRQDHFPFARAGVPGIAFDHGTTYVGRPPGWGEERYRDFVANHYHQPTDQFRGDFDYRGAVQQGRVMLRSAAAVAGAEGLPDWEAGSSFRRPGR